MAIEPLGDLGGRAISRQPCMHTPDFTLPTQSNVDGHIYRLYTFNFQTNDGMRSAYFYAINDEHAHHVLIEMCESADLTSLAAIYGQS